MSIIGDIDPSMLWLNMIYRGERVVTVDRRNSIGSGTG